MDAENIDPVIDRKYTGILNKEFNWMLSYGGDAAFTTYTFFDLTRYIHDLIMSIDGRQPWQQVVQAVHVNINIHIVYAT